MNESHSQRRSGPHAGDVRIGLVGCGRLAERGYVPAFRRARGVSLIAVADVDPERRRSVAPEIPGYASVEELLEGIDVEGVVIATPPDAHLAGARAATAAGVAMLVEKPPAGDVDDAAELAALCPAPWIGFNRRFLLGLGSGRDGVVARATTLHLELCYSGAAWQPYSGTQDALVDAGVHLADLAGWLADRNPLRVRCSTLQYERAALEIDFGDLAATVTCATNAPHREVVEARDGDGNLVLRYSDGGVWRALRRRARTPSEDNPFVNSLTRQLEEFARALRGGTCAVLATAADGVRAMQTLHGAARSAAAGGSWHEF